MGERRGSGCRRRRRRRLPWKMDPHALPALSHPPQGGGGTHDLSLLFSLFFAPPCDSRRRPVRYGIWKHSMDFKGRVESRLAVERLCAGDFSNLFDSMVGLGGSVLLHASIAERGGMRDTHTHTHTHTFAILSPLFLLRCMCVASSSSSSSCVMQFLPLSIYSPYIPQLKVGRESLLHCSLSLD